MIPYPSSVFPVKYVAQYSTLATFLFKKIGFDHKFFWNISMYTRLSLVNF